jgi:hypothetical protein
VRYVLRELREKLSTLRADVRRYNDQHARPRSTEKVIVYGGQCVLEREGGGGAQ